MWSIQKGAIGLQAAGMAQKSASSSYSLVTHNSMAKNGLSENYKDFKEPLNNFNIYEEERRVENLLVWSGSWQRRNRNRNCSVVKIQNEITELRKRRFALYGTDGATSAVDSSCAVVSDHPRVKATYRMQAITVLSAELNGIKMAKQIVKER